MLNYLVVAIGGALGASARYAVYEVAASAGIISRYATAAVNVGGAFAIGMLYVVIIEKSGLQPYGRQFLTVGFLGAFTTYSSYSLDALSLLEGGEMGAALLYLVGTMLACLLATWLGISLTRMV